MNHQTLRNAGLTGISALALALVACGGSSSSAPPAVTPNVKPTIQFLNVPASVQAFHTGVVTFVAADPDSSTAPTVTVNGTAVTTNSYSFVPATVGSTTLTFVVSDGKDSVTVPLTIVVTPNNAPTLPTSAVNVGAASTQNVDLPATDVDKDALSWAVTTVTPTTPATFATLTGNTLKLNAAGVAAGVYTVTLTATETGLTPAKATPLTMQVTVGQMPAGAITAYPTNVSHVYQNIPFEFQFSADSPIPGDTIATWELNDGKGATSTGAAPVESSVTAGGYFSWKVSDDSTKANYVPVGVAKDFGVKATFKSGVVAYQTFRLTPEAAGTAPTIGGANLDLLVVKSAKLGASAITLAAGVQDQYMVLTWDKGGEDLTYSFDTKAVFDTDLPTRGDEVTISVSKVTVDTGATAVDVTSQVVVSLDKTKLAAGTAAGVTPVLTVKSPKQGAIANLGAAVPTAAKNLYVTLKATDKFGLFTERILQIPVRTNTSPTIDQKSNDTAGTTVDSLKFADDITGIVNVVPAEGLLSRWTLAPDAVAAPGTANKASDADGVTKIELIDVKIADAPATGFVSTIVAAPAAGTLQVDSPYFTNDQARKKLELTFKAVDMFGAINQGVKFTGYINGTVHGKQINNLVLGSAAGTTTATKYNFDFASGTAKIVTLNPYSPTSASAKKFNTDLVTPINYLQTGDANSNFKLNSIPGSVFYAKTDVPVSPFATAGTWYYGDGGSMAKPVDFTAVQTGRISALNATPAVKAANAASLVKVHLGLKNPFTQTTDAFQWTNFNLGSTLGTSAYTAASALNSTFQPSVSILNSAVGAWVETNNNADLDYWLDWNGQYLFNTAAGKDVVTIGQITAATVTNTLATPLTLGYWQMVKQADVPFGAPFADGATITANAQMAPMALTNSVSLNVDRNLWFGAAKAQGATDATAYASIATTSDVIKVLAYPHDAANGPVENDNAATLLQTANLKGTLTTDAKVSDFGVVKFGTFGKNTVPVFHYQYDFTRTNTGFTAALPLSMGVMTTTIPADTTNLVPVVKPVTGLVISSVVTPAAPAVPYTEFQNAFVNTGADADGSGTGTAVTAAAMASLENGQITLKWNADAAANSYIISIYDVTAGAIAPATAPNFVIYTAKNEVMLPQTGAAMAKKYVFKVTAVKNGSVDVNTTPFIKSFPYHWADAVSGVIDLPKTLGL